VRYGDYEVYANQPWCQGVTLLQALATLAAWAWAARAQLVRATCTW
jgi:gamma-glutamyltranspeptidase